MPGRPQEKVEPKGPLEASIGKQLSAWMALALRKYPSEKAKIAALATRSGVGKETIRKILRGTQSAQIDNLHALSKTLGWSLVDLFSAIEKQPMEGRVEEGDHNGGSHPLPGELQR